MVLYLLFIYLLFPPCFDPKASSSSSIFSLTQGTFVQITWWLWGEKCRELDFVKNRIPSASQPFLSVCVHISLHCAPSAQISVCIFNSWGWFMFCPKKQRSSPACHRRKPGLVPSSLHSPSAPLLSGMLLASPSWASAPETAMDPSPASPLTPHYSCWWGVRTLTPATQQLLRGRACSLPPPQRSPAAETVLAWSVCPPHSRPTLAVHHLHCWAVITLLRKDSTQDRSRSDFRVCSAPLIKPRAVRREHKQSPLSPI